MEKMYCNPLPLEHYQQGRIGVAGNGPQNFREMADPALLEFEGKYYLFHKEEEFGEINGERRAIRVAVADNPEGPYTIIEGPLNKGQIVPVITEGPSAIKAKDGNGWFLYYDFCMADRFGVSYSPDLTGWTIIEDASFPSEARHGTVSVITADEAERLMSASFRH